MITQLSEHLTFDPKYMMRQQEHNVQYYKDKNVPVAPWACGLIFRDDTGLLNTITGRIVRTPGDYHVIDPMTGHIEKARLTDTCEFMHPAIRYRMSNGPAIAASQTSTPKGSYDPVALKGWTYIPPNQPAPEIGAEAAKWEGYGKWMVKRKDGSVTYIVEEKIDAGTEEMQLLQAWPNVAAKVLD